MNRVGWLFVNYRINKDEFSKCKIEVRVPIFGHINRVASQKPTFVITGEKAYKIYKLLTEK